MQVRNICYFAGSSYSTVLSQIRTILNYINSSILALTFLGSSIVTLNLEVLCVFKKYKINAEVGTHILLLRTL